MFCVFRVLGFRDAGCGRGVGGGSWLCTVGSESRDVGCFPLFKRPLYPEPLNAENARREATKPRLPRDLVC